MIGLLLLAFALMFVQPGNRPERYHGVQPPRAELADTIEQAYVYGYPLVLMDATKRSMTTQPVLGGRVVPANEFAHSDQLATPGDRAVIRPNVDTLYSSAWLDLSNSPVLIHAPNTHGRYHVMQLLDAWTNVFAAPGTRTSGDDAHELVLVGPHYTGPIPQGAKRIDAPTDMVWVINRLRVEAPSDVEAARRIQSGFMLHALDQGRVRAELSQPGVKPEPQPRAPTPPEQVANMDGVSFFRRLAELMKENPAAAADAPALERFREFGFVPGQTFAPGSELTTTVNAAAERAHKQLELTGRSLAASQAGWQILREPVGTYGTDYERRAGVAIAALGANLPHDAVYPSTSVDDAGRPLAGDKKYTLHFAADQLPPVNAFWSITVYDEDGHLIENEMARHALGSRDKLRFNADGSLDLFVQHRAPGGEREANWLPAPKGDFSLLMRLYWPKDAVLSGAWNPPPVRVTQQAEAPITTQR